MRLSASVASRLLVCLGLLSPAGFVTPTLASTPTTTVGNQAGTVLQSACPPGEALVGFAYIAAENLLSISPHCRLIENDTPTGKEHEMEAAGAPYGGPGGAAGVTSTSTECSKGMAAVAMQVYLDVRTDVHHVRLECHVTDGENKAGELEKQTSTLGGDASSHSAVKCPSGAYATGIIGSYGTVINSLGLICHSAEDDTTNADPTQADLGDDAAPNTGADDDTTTNTDSGNDKTIHLQIDLPALKLGLKPAPSGQTRTAHGATTIYAKPAGPEIAYLKADDAVTIVKCDHNGQGWCKISAPKQGYVWGGDLDP